jgi:hypothetical protein
MPTFVMCLLAASMAVVWFFPTWAFWNQLWVGKAAYPLPAASFWAASSLASLAGLDGYMPKMPTYLDGWFMWLSFAIACIVAALCIFSVFFRTTKLGGLIIAGALLEAAVCAGFAIMYMMNAGTWTSFCGNATLVAAAIKFIYPDGSDDVQACQDHWNSMAGAYWLAGVMLLFCAMFLVGFVAPVGCLFIARVRRDSPPKAQKGRRQNPYNQNANARMPPPSNGRSYGAGYEHQGTRKVEMENMYSYNRQPSYGAPAQRSYNRMPAPDYYGGPRMLNGTASPPPQGARSPPVVTPPPARRQLTSEPGTNAYGDGYAHQRAAAPVAPQSYASMTTASSYGAGYARQGTFQSEYKPSQWTAGYSSTASPVPAQNAGYAAPTPVEPIKTNYSSTITPPPMPAQNSYHAPTPVQANSFAYPSYPSLSALPTSQKNPFEIDDAGYSFQTKY